MILTHSKQSRKNEKEKGNIREKQQSLKEQRTAKKKENDNNQ